VKYNFKAFDAEFPADRLPRFVFAGVRLPCLRWDHGWLMMMVCGNVGTVLTGWACLDIPLRERVTVASRALSCD
jgi:hypothetical protein